MFASIKNSNSKYIREHIEGLRKHKRQVLKVINNNVTSQVISGSGKYLFAGNVNGEVFVQDLNQLERDQEPVEILKSYTLPWRIYCMAFCEGNLIIGSDGHVSSLEWNEEREILSTKPSSVLQLPKTSPEFWIAEVNSIYVWPKSNLIVIGCSDFNVYEIDLVKECFTRVYRGHTDYVHSVVGSSDGRVFSASEDGFVKCWQSNCESLVNDVKPSARTELERSELGHFIGDVAISENFLVAGGGPKPAVYHLGTLAYIKPFEFPGAVHAIKIIEDTVYIGGMHNRFESYSLGGGRLTNIPVDMTSVFSIVHQHQPIQFMSLAGYSNNLHILKTFQFLDFKIPLYKIDA